MEFKAQLQTMQAYLEETLAVGIEGQEKGRKRQNF
jgi:hypothetical protein